jgi:hypothetical protein
MFAASPPLNAAPYFRGSGLMDIPTGGVLGHGVFSVGAYFAFRSENEAPRDEAAIQLDFGLFDRVEIGLTSVRFNQRGYTLASLKALLFQEAAAIPNVAIGIEHIGDDIEKELLLNPVEKRLNDLERYQRKSVFLAVSKTFNLPRLHLINGHIGVGDNRYAEDIGMGTVLNGLFFGVSKDFQPAFARGVLTFNVEVDGRGVNAGGRYTADSGLQLYIGAEALNAPATDEKEIRYLVGVAWTNGALSRRIEEARRLAKQAGRIANEAKKAAEASNK